jgi:glycosyltransferase involved in cell wall biosynthesis
MNDMAPFGMAGHADWSVVAPPQPSLASDLAMLAAGTLFDPEWYARAYPDIATTGIDPATHFMEQGWREGRRPNLYFDTAWYLAENPDVAASGVHPVLHYMSAGEAEGRTSSPFFDLAWYAGQHRPDPGLTLLAHFLHRRYDGSVSPLPEFDPDYYLSQYTDIAGARVDPFEHYLLTGYKEGRNPSAGFDTKFYLARYLDGEISENPLLHYRRHRHALRLHPVPPPNEATVFQELHRFTRPGPDFEEVVPLPRTAPRRAKVLAYYLPQYHAVPENDAWWGKGFTEWTSLARGAPRFAGHYQPRVPRDLGHYTLGSTAADTATMHRQIELARNAGLFGFVHYFYWFNRRRLLDGPLEAWLADTTLDFPFCLMWANENWTRRWDGAEQEVLIAQDYDAADDAALVDCFGRHFRDPRYIRIAGRPLLMIYRARHIPDTAATIARWRRLFARRLGENPVLVMSQSFDAVDPREFGFDGAIEFPPHKLTASLPRRNAELAYFDPSADGHVFGYDDVVSASLDEAPSDFPLIKTAVPSWDNDARRQGKGLVLHGSTPAKYEAWMQALVERARARPFMGESLVCVNAWNEWAEGAYLEPDQHFGAAYLNATARAATRSSADDGAARLLLVGHDAFPAGAQQLLLHLARHLQRAAGMRVECLLLGDGALAAEYQAVAPTAVIADPAREQGKLAALIDGWAQRGFDTAIVNTSAAAWIIPQLRAAGIAASLLVHEMPRLIREKSLLGGLRAGMAEAARIIFPSRFVQDRIAALAPPPAGRACVMPQGCYRAPPFSAPARARLRARLGIGAATTLVLGAGYADLRKGFDLFLQAWRAVRRHGADAMFCWIGDIDPLLRTYLGDEIAEAEATGRFRFAGFQNDIASWFSAADVFALTSREDPFPSVVLEALAAGLPSVAFSDSGGIPDMLRDLECGRAVPMADAQAMALAALEVAAAARKRGERARLAGLARAHFAFDRYAGDLLHLVRPTLVPVSVVVPSYNYAAFLEQRLASIFAQTYPVAEIVVLDDASTDDSIAVARRVAADWQRDVTLHVNAANTGSVFRQWRRAAECARAEYVWIAEADDAADPDLLAQLAELLRSAPDIDLAFCDSRAIDRDGALLWPSYRDYYTQSGASGLAQNGVFPAREFARTYLSERNLILNASAVVWKRAALLAALERCGADLDSLKAAGDWRLYVELMAESPGNVAYLAAPLNIHRRHDASVTHCMAAAVHLSEIARMHRLVREKLAPDAQTLARQDAYLAEIAEQFALPTRISEHPDPIERPRTI